MNINVAQKFSSFQYCVSLMIDCITCYFKNDSRMNIFTCSNRNLKKGKKTKNDLLILKFKSYTNIIFLGLEYLVKQKCSIEDPCALSLGFEGPFQKT